MFECLGENTEQYKAFSIPIEKEVTKIGKNSNKSFPTIPHHKIKFINFVRFMASSIP